MKSSMSEPGLTLDLSFIQLFFARKEPVWDEMPLLLLNLFQDEENEWMAFYKYKYVLKLLEPVPKV